MNNSNILLNYESWNESPLQGSCNTIASNKQIWMDSIPILIEPIYFGDGKSFEITHDVRTYAS
ncbi:MAG: hypothetical protein IPP46_06075 [Bacteroidetes bacterium]|nr:hypothetical protein [Bacteroidota bacterium]